MPKLLLALALLAGSLPLAAQDLPEDVTARKVDVYSEGTRMAGHLFAPKAAAEGQRLPTIVMAHGWGGTQQGLRRNAVGFAQHGYLVLTFDYRGWGESDSRVILTEPQKDVKATRFTAEVRTVREVVDIGDQTTDWLNAIHFVAGEPQADMTRLGLWGSSNSGGLVVWAAAHDPRVRAVHSQVSGGLGALGVLNQQALQDATRRARGELDYPEPAAEFGNLRGAPIPHRYATYTPGIDIRGNDRVALQFVLAEVEEYGGNPAVKAVYERHQGPKNLVVIEGIGHYDIYRDAWQRAQDLALAWFDRQLAPASP